MSLGIATPSKDTVAAKEPHMSINDLRLDVGQANELKLAFQKYGYTNRDIKRLTEGDRLGDVLEVLKGFSAVTRIRGPVINCDAEPRIPEGMVAIDEHRKMGAVEWIPRAFKFVYPRPAGDRDLLGTTIRKDLKNVPVLNACVLDFMLANPHLIPDEWFHPHGQGYLSTSSEGYGSGCLTFWGTIYRDDEDKLHVPALVEDKGLYLAVYIPLDRYFYRSVTRAIMM